MKVALALAAALLAATASAARAQGPAASSLDAYRPVDLGPGTARGAEAALAGDVIDQLAAGNVEEARRKILDEIDASRRAGDAVREAMALDVEGLIHQRVGQPTLAADSHALALGRLDGVAGSAALGARLNALNNLAVARYFAGQYEDALETLAELAAIPQLNPQNVQHRLALARAHNNRGLVEQELGREDDARTSFDKALRAVGRRPTTGEDKLLRAQVLNNLGRSYGIEAADWEEARDRLADALTLAREVPSARLEANILDSTAEALLAAAGSADERRQRAQEALRLLDEAGRLQATAPVPLLAVTILKTRGRALARLGRSADALTALTEAVRGANQLLAPGLQRDVLGARAEVSAGAGNLDGAIADLRRAIELAESTQGRALRESERQRLVSIQRLYAALVEAYIAKGELDRAVEFLDRGGSAALRHELLQRTPALRDKDAEKALGGYQGLLKREAALATQLLLAQAGGADGDKDARRLATELDDVRRRGAQALGELQHKYGQREYSLYFSVNALDFAQLGRALPPGHLIVTYFAAEDSLYLFLASRDAGFTWRQVAGVRRVDLARKVRRYRELITQRQPSWRVDSWDDAPWKEVRELSASLYRDLLAPIEREWKAAEHLVIAPTGLLHYLPFHALGPYDASARELRFVALDTSVSYLTNAGRTDVVTGPRKPRARTLLALGNPPYRHERPRLSQLQFAEREVNELKTLLGPNALVLAGADASLANLQSGLGGGSMVATRGGSDGPQKFGILHLATHGVIDARSPADSWLAFDGTNRLRASDVATLDLAATHLATLSACQTAIADDKPGTDVMSLAAYFVTAGVPSVLVSLWNVDDRATGELMVKFYQALAAQGDPLHKGKALQAAQRALATRPETRHPYLWAAFELIGDWR